MDYFEDVYLKRLNRYGIDHQSRILGQRKRTFSELLLKSSYQVTFTYENQTYLALKERYKQDETETLQYLLTELEVNIPNGTILMIENKDGIQKPWMIYWLEEIKTSGYNRYIILRMTHFIKWIDKQDNHCSSWCYLYGQEDNMLKNEIRSRSRTDTIYAENLKGSFFVMPVNASIKKDVYLEIGEDTLKEGYVVTGYDIQSSPGIEYVTIDPTYLRDNSAYPVQWPGDKKEDFYWLNNGGEGVI